MSERTFVSVHICTSIKTKAPSAGKKASPRYWDRANNKQQKTLLAHPYSCASYIERLSICAFHQLERRPTYWIFLNQNIPHTHTRGGSKTIAKPPNFPLPGRTESSRSAKELNSAEINKQTKTRTSQRRTSPTAYPTGSASDWVSWEKHTKRNPPLCSIARLRGGFKTETLCGGSQQQSVSKSKGTHLRFACASGRCPGK